MAARDRRTVVLGGFVTAASDGGTTMNISVRINEVREELFIRNSNKISSIGWPMATQKANENYDPEPLDNIRPEEIAPPPNEEQHISCNAGSPALPAATLLYRCYIAICLLSNSMEIDIIYGRRSLVSCGAQVVE